MKMSTEPDFVWISPSEMKRRIRTIPLPKNVKTTFLNTVQRWVAHSGTEWSVGRLKSFKDYLMQVVASGSVENQYKPEWFKTTPSGQLAGVWGSLTRLAMENSKQFQACLFLVNLYTGVVRRSPSDALISEISSEIQQSAVRIPARGHGKVGLNDVFKAFKVLNPRVRKRCELPVPLTMVSPGKESHTGDLAEDVLQLAGSPLYKGGKEKLVNNKFLLDAALGAENCLMSSKFSTLVGGLHMTMEPGLKTRYFAAPNQVVQRALEPLKDLLLQSLAAFPWDCTLDQRKADSAITQRLRDGGVVHSVDMSKATDNFPWLFQYTVGTFLTKDVARSMLDLMDDVVRNGYWAFPNGKRVRWTKGQPLGLGPSFPLFTISHGILLFILNGNRWEQDYYVLGDDVVILNDLLADKYRKVLVDWEVQVSESKSFTSSRLAQFAGVTYTPDTSFFVPKWRPFTRANLLDCAAWWYPGLTQGLPEHDLICRVLALPQPYGLGWNPKGLPLDERFSQNIVKELLEREDKRAQTAIRSATRVDMIPITDALRKRQVSDETVYALQRMLCDASVTSYHVPSVGINHSTSTEVSLLSSVTALMHGTEVAGYPRLRQKASRIDPYTIGNIRSWKRLFDRSDSATKIAE